MSFHVRLSFIAVLLAPALANGQDLTQRLLAVPAAELASDAARQGDPRRGAVVFYQPYMACMKCHSEQASQQRIGPDLARLEPKPTDADLVDSVLRPSKTIKKGFQSITVVTTAGRVVRGVLVERNAQRIVVRDAEKNFEVVSIPADEIENDVLSDKSIMPAGQVNVLASRQQFLDLVRYLMEIRDGGAERARELEPPPSLYAAAPLPEYESKIDHAGMIRSLDGAALKRGEAIYLRVCANCHGTHDRPGSLPTSLKFASGKFKNGHDPFTMYQTVTRGFGLMVPQSWMVPEQKYDVIHYIRETYLKSHNTSQYFAVDDDYLASLPAGDTRGPKPRNIQPWQQMNYGPNLVATYEVGSDGKNFAYKGNAVRLGPGPGGVSRGRSWMIFDYDTLRMAAAWQGNEFIDYNGINFNGRHGIHPRVAGEVHFANPTGPGWARPGTDSFEDTRLIGRDGRRYGPLPREWAQYRGMYYHGNDTIVSYTVGKAAVLETQSEPAGSNVFARHFEIGPRDTDLRMQVAHLPKLAGSRLAAVRLPSGASRSLTQVVRWGESSSPAELPQDDTARFDGGTYLQVNKSDTLDMDAQDYTIRARIKTDQDGTIFCQTQNAAKWSPNGKTFFLRGGRLAFDIGWVGAVHSPKRVNDNRWHDVAVSYHAAAHRIDFFVDGKPAGGGQLQPQAPKPGQVFRIGFTASNFPKTSYFNGELQQVEFIQSALKPAEISQTTVGQHPLSLGVWSLADGKVTSPRNLPVTVVRGETPATGEVAGAVLSGLATADPQATSAFEWTHVDGNLRLRIPAGDQPLRFTVWMTRLGDSSRVAERLTALSIADPSRDLKSLMQGGQPRWPEVVTTKVQRGDASGPFAVDTLTYPKVNPWLCRMRLTGHDFYSDNDRAAVCDWDGNVWLVAGLSSLDKPGGSAAELTWKRIASGLFQPLGLRIIDDVIHLTCRDQLCRLHDLNGDDAIDWFECINNDHQVTDHFHEFAMGLQTDDDGNFYYAKSARHALTAVVPHHGTLLRISKDGDRTDILATGFRAANGVCLNPDGTFIVTDQEGHWNPKNRINWVRPGGFYGNMFGYHDVTDESDEAMEQPLCWITNAFDRSPAELLWVDSQRWGPLSGRLLNISYGYGKVFLVPHEEVDGQMQGGMIELPIPQFPTGTIRGRFHPADGQLYLTGMFAWAGSRSEPGGFYRLRYTGRPVHLPVDLRVRRSRLELEFSGDLDAAEAAKAANYDVKVWDLKRTRSYGSKHYNERALTVKRAKVAGRVVTLEVPDIGPTWCMEIRYRVKGSGGEPVTGVIHNTIHSVKEE